VDNDILVITFLQYWVWHLEADDIKFPGFCMACICRGLW